MERLKAGFKNPPFDWNGDPCLPRLYSWTGVTCSGGPRIRVTTLWVQPYSSCLVIISKASLSYHNIKIFNITILFFAETWQVWAFQDHFHHTLPIWLHCQACKHLRGHCGYGQRFFFFFTKQSLLLTDCLEITISQDLSLILVHWGYWELCELQPSHQFYLLLLIVIAYYVTLQSHSQSMTVFMRFILKLYIAFL